MSRNAMLAKVHIAAKELGLDEDAYRDTLESITGKRSAGQLSYKQLNEVLTAFKRQGFKPKKFKKVKQEDMPMASTYQVKKALVIWQALAKHGTVRDGSYEALVNFAKRHAQCDSEKWLGVDEWMKVIEALKSWAQRENVHQVEGVIRVE